MIKEQYRPKWNEYKKGDILLVNLGEMAKEGQSEPHGIRPVVVISNDLGNKHSPTLLVAIMKTSKADLPTHVFVESRDLLRKDSYIMCEHIRSIDKFRVIKMKTKLRPNELNALNHALKISQGLV